MKSDEAAIARVMDGSVWDDFCEALKTAGRQAMDAAPADPLDRAEGLRYVGRLAAHALGNFIERSDPTRPSVTVGLPKVGGDNPDNIYATAPLRGDCEYVLRGNVGETSALGFGSYTGDVGTSDGLRLSGYLAGDALELDREGDFERRISGAEQPGNWLPILGDTTQLMIRQALSNRRTQRWATFEIECTQGRGEPTPLLPVRYASQLDRAGEYVIGVVDQFLDWTRDVEVRPNSIQPVNPALMATAQGDPSIHYYSGYFELGLEEALVVDLVPPTCTGWNFQLCNHWLESLDHENHSIHVNERTAVAAADGSVRIIVADVDPGLSGANWLDTAGHRRGGIFLRWIGTETPFDPVCSVIKAADLGR